MVHQACRRWNHLIQRQTIANLILVNLVSQDFAIIKIFFALHNSMDKPKNCNCALSKFLKYRFYFVEKLLCNACKENTNK